jgi:hypothetical protein
MIFQLHRHALLNSKRGVSVDENGKKLDDEISIISSTVHQHNRFPLFQNKTDILTTFQQFQKFYKQRFSPHTKRIASDGWHAE